MTWYTFQDWVWTSGPDKGKPKVYNVTGTDNLELEATGAHGYPTEKDALAKPNASPNAAQEALLATFSVQATFPIGGGVAGAQSPTPPVNVPGTQGGFFGAVVTFLEALTDITTWRSLAWIFLGAILVIAGIYLWLKQNDLIPQTTPVPVPVPL